MKKASITYTKNNLSRLLDSVREGETVWITDRDVPVAELSPVEDRRVSTDARVAELVRAGLATPPRSELDVRRFAARKLPALSGGVSGVQALLEERESSR